MRNPDDDSNIELNYVSGIEKLLNPYTHMTENINTNNIVSIRSKSCNTKIRLAKRILRK